MINIFQRFVTIFALTLVVSAIVSYLYSLLVHGTGIVDWEGSVRFAIIFGILIPAIQEIDRRKKS